MIKKLKWAPDFDQLTPSHEKVWGPGHISFEELWPSSSIFFTQSKSTEVCTPSLRQFLLNGALNVMMNTPIKSSRRPKRQTQRDQTIFKVTNSKSMLKMTKVDVSSIKSHFRDESLDLNFPLVLVNFSLVLFQIT